MSNVTTGVFYVLVSLSNSPNAPCIFVKMHIRGVKNYLAPLQMVRVNIYIHKHTVHTTKRYIIDDVAQPL